MTKALVPTQSFSLGAEYRDDRVVAFNVSQQGDVWIVEALNKPDYRTENNGFATFPRTVPASPQRYRIRVLREGSVVLDLNIEQERFNIHNVQPLGDDLLLLVCSRSHYRGPDDFDRNGRIYDRSGHFQREMLLGDGIQAVQATSAGSVWVSYFDEGVFGNFGWSDPVGSSGLVEWSSAGKKLYEYQPNNEIDSIVDCYALNVSTNADVWCYYYTDFPLVHLHDRRIVATWKIPVAGGHAFAVRDDEILLCGSYKARDRLYRISLGTKGTARIVDEHELRDQESEPIKIGRVVGRGPSLYVLDGRKLHVISLSIR